MQLPNGKEEPPANDVDVKPSCSVSNTGDDGDRVVAATSAASTINNEHNKSMIHQQIHETTRLLKGLRLPGNGEDSLERRHPFWDTQPVIKREDFGRKGLESGPIDTNTDVSSVRPEPFSLPVGFIWSECDVMNDEILSEIYELLANHYVEDDDNLFRFNYSRDFLRWNLTPPGAHKNWIIGVRVGASGKLVGFITALPTSLRVYGKEVEVAEVNFLCVHKRLRSKRLAPVLIKEITRRVNSRGIWQAAYTAGVLLPTPVTECRYWHRSLNPKKLIEVGFSPLGPRMTISRCIKLYRVRETPALSGLRELVPEDVPAVHKLLQGYMKNFKLAANFTEEEVRHWLSPRSGVVHVYVRSQRGKITDMLSFYEVPSLIIGNPKHKELKAAYSYYNVATSVPLKDLMEDALCFAKQKNFDVFNALELMENSSFLEALKFGIGDGNLRYYLYNWMCPPVEGGELALVLH